MNRADVFKLIDGERQYQNALAHHSEGQDINTSVAAWIVYMETHIAKAKAEIYRMDVKAALSEVRKVTALGVACMEHNETAPR